MDRKEQQTQISSNIKKRSISDYIIIILIGLFILPIITQLFSSSSPLRKVTGKKHIKSTFTNSNNVNEPIKSTFTNANVGDYVEFGNYPQTAKGGIQPIEWQVLAKDANKMLLISKYGLETRRFTNYPKKSFGSDADISNNWINSEIRQWANNDFYNKAFNEKEKKYIKSFDGDNVFLLSKEEVEKYFANNDERKCRATKYAKANGALLAPFSDYCNWWLRSPSTNLNDSVYYVEGDDGYINDIGVLKTDYVFRPALWINI